MSSRVSILQWTHGNGYVTDSDFENNFLSLLTMERECQNYPPRILSKRKRRRQEERLVSQNSLPFLIPVQKRKVCAGKQGGSLLHFITPQANLSPIPIPFLTLPTFSSATESERPLWHSPSARTPPVICNIPLATRGTSAPCSGLDCQCTGWGLTESRH